MLTDAAFAMAGICRVEIHHDKADVASAGVPQRLGFVFVRESADGPDAPGEVGVEWVWRMERPSWSPDAQ
jgi:ribosomal-protein-serine acetyltransferase